ncbi:BatD family protein [Vibrio maritimus]|uniref:BatD family protein n=1 Tax=Vibrio maritimus TaxID=990268 RepID=UPI001F251F64|nr:BatD family protein [Vibrio maritimus]
MKSRLSFIRPLIVILTILTSYNALALNVSASVTKTNVSKDEVIQLKVMADEKLDGSKVNFDVLSDDFFMGRPNFSSSVNILNGTRTDSSIWTIAIAPQRLGKIVIPSFDVDGVKTSPITLNVTMDEQTPTTDDLIEVRTQLSKSELYPKESTILDTRIIVKVDPRLLQNPSLSDPIATGLNIEPIAEPKQYQAVMDGVEVLIVDQSYHVTAKESGDFTITAPTLRGGVLYGNNRNGSTKILSLDGKAPQASIRVLPIPDDYNGIWLPTASLTAEQSWTLDNGEELTSNSVTLQAGDALTRTISVTAQGVSQEQMPALTITNPRAFRVYPEKPSFISNPDGSVTMTMKQVLIAKSVDKVKLPALDIQWWNTKEKKADTTTLAGLEVDIEQGEGSVPALPSTSAVVPPTPQTITDAGIWPALTALFAALWLAFVFLWYRERSRAPKTASQEVFSTGKYRNTAEKDQFIQAIKSGDPILAQSCFEHWRKQERLPEDFVTFAQSELNRMSKSSLGHSSGAWDNKQLIERTEKLKLAGDEADSLARL